MIRFRSVLTTRLFCTALLLATSAACRFGLDNPQVGDGGLVVPPGCGDGVLGGGEECDDGNFDNSDHCLENCRIASCGDGFVRSEVEVCDDGNDDDGDGCTRFCGLCPNSAAKIYTSPVSENCYALSSLPNQNIEAEMECVQQGGHLVGFATAEEHIEVSLALSLTEPTWIGLRFVEGSWRWFNGDPEVFSNWDTGFPTAEIRTLQLPNGEWQSVPDLAHPFLCEIPGGDRWTVRPEDGHAYRIFTTALSKPVAQASCADLGAYLAEITSAEEAAFIRSQLDPAAAWIGLSDPASDGQYVWDSGARLEFEDWADTEPNNNGGPEDCVVLSDRWADVDCAGSRVYLCERE